MKTRICFWSMIVLIASSSALTLLTRSAVAQDYKKLHDFTDGADGATPFAGLTIDGSGNLYGTTANGGLAGGCGGGGCGTVFKLSRSGSGWVFTTLYDFAGGGDGSYPRSRVVFGPSGSLYGTTSYTVFKLRPSTIPCLSVPCPWTETVLYRFAGGTDGSDLQGEPIFDSLGNIYGITYSGGRNGLCNGDGCGTVYKLTPSNGGWTKSQVYAFSGGSDGGNPRAAVVLDTAGNLYGTTSLGGTSGAGTVFQLTPSGSGWTENTIRQFDPSVDGSDSYAALIFDPMGNLYGTTSSGGPQNSGTVFELSLSGGSWIETIIDAFDPQTATGPLAGVTMDNGGNLFGTTYGGEDFPGPGGYVFELIRSGAGWLPLDVHSFLGSIDGRFPTSTLAFDANSNLYGTTSEGGAYHDSDGDGFGIVYETKGVTALFSDLGPTGNLYQCCTGWTVAGSGALGTSFTAANQFTVSGNGNFDVTRIHLAVGFVSGTNAFYASIWTDDGGLPGTQVPGAFWGGLAGLGSCCSDLVSIPVAGVTLTGGQSYFMILGPMNLNDTTFEAWNWNNQGIDGLDLYSNDGGSTWNSNGSGNPLGAFDVIGGRH